MPGSGTEYEHHALSNTDILDRRMPCHTRATESSKRKRFKVIHPLRILLTRKNGDSVAMRVELANLFGCPEGLEIFYYLAARKVLLFPGENCFICEVEAEPTPHGGLTVRVMWATGRDSPADVVMK